MKKNSKSTIAKIICKIESFHAFFPLIMKHSFTFVLLAGFIAFPCVTFAAESPPNDWLKTITFYQDIYDYKLPLDKHPEFFHQVPLSSANLSISQDDNTTVCYWKNTPQSLASPLPAPENMKWVLDRQAARNFFYELIVPKVNREAEHVRIFRNEKGEIQFEGVGNFGKQVDVEQAVSLLDTAIQNGIDRIELPIIKTQPQVTVDDPELKESGIRDLISVGESDFSGSTMARMQNVEIGASKFNGFFIKQGETASFNDHLGPVNADYGYVKELVIIGPKVEKEYGGGLCQVSSTAFRAALLAGLPIKERYPHAFAVHYYEPWGTDATIYPGNKDLKFVNDTPGAILVQTTMDRPTKKLQFHYYGTDDGRKVKMFGPRIFRPVGPLAARSETSTKLKPGEVQHLSNAVPGFDAQWFRVVIPSVQSQPESTSATATQQIINKIYSRYTPRGNWTIRGVEAEPSPAATEI